ncbi:MAG: 2-oxoglutarate dehydrogenase E1 component [Gammaproteobacteria bacterium]|nr:2-oxoglutarate dehydrogenase E1 component [Gammaproteobacteria bacterium]
MKKQQRESYLFGSNAAYFEDLYSQYLLNENSVDEEWRDWFKSLKNDSTRVDADHVTIREQVKQAVQNKKSSSVSVSTSQHAYQLKQISVLQLINAYRFRGYQKAKLDPLALTINDVGNELSIEAHDLSQDDLKTVFSTGSMFGIDEAPLEEIIERLQKTYCGAIGSEFMYIANTEQKRWIQEKLESVMAKPNFKHGRRMRILDRIIAAENLEKYLHTRYVGQKRFSLEGGESLIPLLDRVIQQGGKEESREVVIGMAHRGRLNVLINILGKTPKDLFDEFEGNVTWNNKYNYDVKYHQGFSSDVNTESGPTHLALAFNPSHLEIVNPVVEGSVRSRQRLYNKKSISTTDVMPVLIHGDSAFAGQGVVMETFNMCQTRGYHTGGTIHIIVNNQIGFTTSHPKDMRSTLYCTEVARMVQAPIFHVNGDDPEACVFAAELAVQYRKKYHRDVVIDMICYRRYGHNEADEPAATQPKMYAAIRNHPRLVEKHSQVLIDAGVIDRATVDNMISDYRKALDHGGTAALNVISGLENQYRLCWEAYTHGDIKRIPDTSLNIDHLKTIGKTLVQLPEGFELHHRVKKVMEARAKMLDEEVFCDWGFAETMAYGTLLSEGKSIRLSGQDSERGTFFHRHAVLHDQTADGGLHVPLKQLQTGEARFEVINSFLSEEAVLGFEYGYASTDPETLVLWEAQFGDFANGAQVVIDQFISSGEVKWGRLCNLVMLLPHGYEGQGPEHSSARLERYLQLVAQDNMRIVMPTMPAQIYHLLRSQLVGDFRKPLIVMTPKSLLRHEAAVSPLSDLADGQFKPVIEEADELDVKSVKRLIICSGKIYFKLHETRQQKYDNSTAIVRIEQLYPYPIEEVGDILNQYPYLEKVIWCQDEPRNQGAWWYIKSLLMDSCKDITVGYAGRQSSASPAAGYMGLHLEQEHQLVAAAFEM